MQDKKMKTVLLSVPLEVLAEAGIMTDGVLEMYADGNRIIVQNADVPGDFICDGDCEGCPMSEIDCTGDCKSCPCFEDCEDAEVSQ